MSGLDRHQVAAARLWAADRFPYLASALFAAQVVPAPGSGTVGADQGWRLYVDPDVVAGWSVPQLGSTFVHQLGHLLREHGRRAGEVPVGEDDAEAWTSAADAEINDDLAGAGLEPPTEPVLPASLGCEDGRLAEEYFETVRRRAEAEPDDEGEEGDDQQGEDQQGEDQQGEDQQGEDQQGEDEQGEAPQGEGEPDTGDQPDTGEAAPADCGSAAHGQAREWEQPGDTGTLSDAQADLVRRKVAHDLLEHAKAAGDVPAGLRRWAEDLLDARVDWRRALAAELRRGIADVAGRVDYSYRRPSRRAASVEGVVLPALRRPVPHVAVVCDTSASMTDDLLARALAEVQGVLDAVGVRGDGLRVLSVDAAVHAARRVTSARQVDLAGGGGTDMAAGIDAALAGRPRPDLVVVLTDGWTPWPPQAPARARVVVGLLDPSAPPPPEWARTVLIDEPVDARR